MRRPVSRRAIALALVLAVALRVALVVLIVPPAQSTWFAPFLHAAATAPSIDPWSSWLAAGGRSDAFPYGPVMLIWFGFWSAALSWLPIPAAPQIGIGVALIALDAIAALVVWRSTRRFPDRSLLVLVASPIVVVASYLHGQLDMLPAVLLLLGMVDVRARRFRRGGLWIGLAIAAKLSSLLVVPLLVMFFVRDVRQRPWGREVVLGALPGIGLSLLCLLSPGYRVMVLAAPQFESVFAFALRLAPQFALQVAPVVVLTVCALFWRFSRLNTDLLVLYTAVMLLVVPLLAPASPGWYLWSVPLLALLIGETRFRYLLLLLVVWTVLAVSSVLTYSTGSWRWSTAPRPAPGAGLLSVLPVIAQRVPWLMDFVSTAGVVLGLLLGAILLIRLGRRFDQYQLSSAPFSLAVAGDSGTGKDTLCISLSQVFGEVSTAFVMGDDYHRHERGAPAWRVRTHLDPAANDIARLVRDTVGLLRGDLVYSRHYDHHRGRFTEQRPLVRGDLVVVSGLHVLASTSIRDEVDLSVFLDMDEDLRTLLKIRRDHEERGHAPQSVIASIQTRAADRVKFVQPQERLADLVLRLEPAVPLHLDEDLTEIPPVPPLRLVLTMRSLTFGEELQRALIALVAMQATVQYLREPGAVRLEVEDVDLVSSADVAALAAHLISREQEVFVGSPSWLGGSFGVCQLVLALALLERRRRADEDRSR